MDHLAFYNVGCEPSPGPAGIKARIRRQLRRLLLPSFQRLTQILASVCHRLDVAEHEARDLKALVDDLRRRQEEQAARIPATIAFGWDYVAMVRRLAVLEEHVDALLSARSAPEPAAGPAEPPARFGVANSLEADQAPRARVG